jgi:hypothetical protein
MFVLIMSPQMLQAQAQWTASGFCRGHDRALEKARIQTIDSLVSCGRSALG